MTYSITRAKPFMGLSPAESFERAEVFGGEWYIRYIFNCALKGNRWLGHHQFK